LRLFQRDEQVCCTPEFTQSRRPHPLQYPVHGIDQPFIVAHELAVLAKIDGPIEQCHSANGEQIHLVQAKGKSHPSFLEKLNYLHEMLARIPNGKESRRGLGTEARSDGGAIDQYADEVIRDRKER
jgi:hypothetical protein